MHFFLASLWLCAKIDNDNDYDYDYEHYNMAICIGN